MRHFTNHKNKGGGGARSALHSSSSRQRMTRPPIFGDFDDEEEKEEGGAGGGHRSLSRPSKSKPKEDEEKGKEEEEEDDYMKMTFADPTPSLPETSLQRRRRLEKEGLRRGMVPSKAQLAEQERERREEGLSRSLFSSRDDGEEGILYGDKIAAERRRKKEEQDAAAAAAAAQQQQQQQQIINDKNTKKSKGLAMMAKMGFTPGTALGKREEGPGQNGEEEGGGGKGRGLVEPLRIQVREDRGGIGLGDERKRKLREALGEEEGGEDGEKKKANNGIVVDEGDYRERMARERDLARKERLVLAAQKIAERMDEEDDERRRAEKGEENNKAREQAGAAAAASSRPLKAIPVLYRGLVRHREEAERDRRARHDLEQSSSITLTARLPTFVDEDLDAYDRMAVGREEQPPPLPHLPSDTQDNSATSQHHHDDGGTRKTEEEKKSKTTKTATYMPADDLDEPDDDLDAFGALDAGERLARLVAYLRARFRYCFWCKSGYPDEAMEGCPGVTEEDHD